MRNKRAAESSGAADGERKPSGRSSATWAMLIKRVYELDPLACPQCGGEMIVVAFIEPPQADVIEKILRHCGLWNESSARAPPPVAAGGTIRRDARAHSSAVTRCSSDGSHELTYVDQDSFDATF